MHLFLYFLQINGFSFRTVHRREFEEIKTRVERTSEETIAAVNDQWKEMAQQLESFRGEFFFFLFFFFFYFFLFIYCFMFVDFMTL